MLDFTCRVATAKDAAELLRLNALFNRPGCTQIEALTEALRSSGTEIVYVAERAARLIGFCCGQLLFSFCYDRPHGEITELYVETADRGKGVGKALVACVEEAFAGRGADGVHILTGADNLVAQRLYSRCGYARSGEIHYEKEIDMT